MKIKVITLLVNALLVFGFGAVLSQGQTRRILMVVTSHDKLGDTGKKTGFYLSEVTHPHKVFIDAGFAVDFVSPQGGAAPMTAVNLKDPLNKAFLDDAELMKKIQTTMKPSQVDVKKYDAVFYAGGHGTMWDFPDNSELAAIASKIYERGGVVGGVCHGPTGLINVKLSNGRYLVDGKTVSAFTNEEEANFIKIVPFLLETKLIERGAKITKAPKFEAHVVTSERLVTGQNPASAKGVAESMVQLLKETK